MEGYAQRRDASSRKQTAARRVGTIGGTADASTIYMVMPGCPRLAPRRSGPVPEAARPLWHASAMQSLEGSRLWPLRSAAWCTAKSLVGIERIHFGRAQGMQSTCMRGVVADVPSGAQCSRCNLSCIATDSAHPRGALRNHGCADAQARRATSRTVPPRAAPPTAHCYLAHTATR